MIEDYFRQIATLIATASIIHSSSITYDKRSTSIGFIRGEISFLDGSQLHLREFVNVERGTERYMYVYHYQRPDGTLVFRYDTPPTSLLCPLSLTTSMKPAKQTSWRLHHLTSRPF